jgi:hypothetical protein
MLQSQMNFNTPIDIQNEEDAESSGTDNEVFDPDYIEEEEELHVRYSFFFL